MPDWDALGVPEGSTYATMLADTIIDKGLRGAVGRAVRDAESCVSGNLPKARKACVTFTRNSFASAIIDVPADLADGDANSPEVEAVALDWYDFHHDELEWSHDGCEETFWCAEFKD